MRSLHKLLLLMKFRRSLSHPLGRRFVLGRWRTPDEVHYYEELCMFFPTDITTIQDNLRVWAVDTTTMRILCERELQNA